MPAPRITLRPHHLMCVHGFKGNGYSPKFVANFWKVIENLNAPDARIEVVGGTLEDICKPCPNNQGKVCSDEPKIRKLDDAYAATLMIKPGDKMSWSDAKKLIVAKVTDEDFDRNCAPCAWRKLGLCKEALHQLRKTALVVVALFAFSQAAHAQDAVPAATEVKFTTADQLEQALLLDKSKRIPALFKVQSALNSHEWKKAIDAAKALESKADYADYYHYLLGQAELGRMKKFLREGASATAMAAGEQAKFHLMQVPGSNPYTTLSRRASALLGEAEITMGDIHARAKRRPKAVVFMENGFQRLSQVNQLALVPKQTIISYALICEKKPTDICGSWVSKLAPFVIKSEGERVFDRLKAFKRPYIERVVQMPYKIDLDLQAFQKGFTSFVEGKHEDAYATWRDLLRDFPRTTIKLRTKFWMGRAAQKSQHDAQAETLFREVIKELPFSYYALLSSWFGNIELSRMMDAEVPIATDETPLLTPSDVVHIKRAEALIASAVPELAVLELQDVRPTVNMPNEFLVYLVALNNLAGNHNAAFQMLGELSTRSFQGLFSSYGQKLYFPTTRLPLIRDLAKEWKVDPLLVISIVKQESAFNVDAVSSANAYGLMQLIPPTARDMDGRVEIMDLFNPMVNVRLGSKYIKHLMNRYKGSIIPALAAYNAGPGNSDRWVREAPANLQAEEYIEMIGYRETREYVQNVLRNYYWYSRRIKGESSPSLQSLAQYIQPAKGATSSGAATQRGQPAVKIFSRQ